MFIKALGLVAIVSPYIPGMHLGGLWGKLWTHSAWHLYQPQVKQMQIQCAAISTAADLELNCSAGLNHPQRHPLHLFGPLQVSTALVSASESAFYTVCRITGEIESPFGDSGFLNWMQRSRYSSMSNFQAQITAPWCGYECIWHQMVTQLDLHL